MVGVHGHALDGFMWPLLKVTRGHDRIQRSYTPLIEKLFNEEDKDGLLNIDKNLFPEFYHTNKKKDHGKKKRSYSAESLFEYHNKPTLY